MTLEDRDLVMGTAAWIARGRAPDAHGLSVEDAAVAAREFLRLLRTGAIAPPGDSPNPVALDVLHAACRALREEADAATAREGADALLGFLEEGEWESILPDERAELQSASAFAGWRASRRLGDPRAAARFCRRLASAPTSSPVRLQCDDLLVRDATSGVHRPEHAMEDPEALLLLCGLLRTLNDSTPALVRDRAESFYRSVKGLGRRVGLFDEHDFFLGEMALLAGAACRQLSRREETVDWFRRAEAAFRLTSNAEGDLCRLTYQRLAEQIEERQIGAVRALLPSLEERFRDLGMPDDALKCRFLDGLTLMETDELPRAADLFEDVCREAQLLENEKLLATSYGNLAHVYGIMGDADRAILASERAVPLLKRQDDRIALVKVQWGLAALLREKGQTSAAIVAYRDTQQQFATMGMRADTAALHLVIADLLLEQGKNDEAFGEISAALPVIAELKMASEGMAALSLLRESTRGQDIDRAALQALHRYFQQLRS